MTRTLLVVDDNKLNREIIRNMLGVEYRVLEASDGREAIDIMLKDYKSISAVLLDINMPKMDGYQVLRNIRSDALLELLPVIMITGDESEESRTKALSLGANDFIMKPYRPEIIRHCLRNCIALRETKAAVDALQRDRLTGLYTREAFFDKVSALVNEQKPGYYIMTCFDIEKFKVINDQYGTEKGDQVLRHVANSFRNGFESHGGICCRVFADNFAVLYPASFAESEEIVAIRKKASHIDGIIFPIHFSIGRYVVEDLSMPPAAMYDRAALALSMIKGRYDNAISVYDEKMREHLIHEQIIVTEMAYALKNNQFEVWLQPQNNHSTNARIGAEALVRWRHPEKGLISPDDFISIFEQNGFIYMLDKFVWEEVCKCIRRWTDEGYSPLPISVNVSRFDILQADMVETILELLKKYKLPVSSLRLEITESAFAESSQNIVGVVKELISRGFTVEIDDFGSGYSSLNTLKDVPAQIIKLDMKFLENSSDNQRGGNIIESVVRMAKWLGMSVIAEGVETPEQADFLRSIGCNYIQGYLYSRPLPISEYELLMGNSEREEKLITLETVKNLDNNAFWDAKSMDTLIFNSYVGAACIFEFHNDNAELIRATEKYAQIIGNNEITVEDVLKINWRDHLDESGRKQVRLVLEESIRGNKEITSEFIFYNLPGCPEKTYLRSTLRVIATAGLRYLVYCASENITAQKESEMREHEVFQQLQAILKSIDSGVSANVIKDDKLIPVFANDSYFRQLGYSRDQYEKEFKEIPGFIVPEERQMVMDRSKVVCNSGKPDTIEFHIIRGDGAKRLLRSNVTIMDYPGLNEPVQLSVTSDVTDQRKAEEKIRQLSNQMQSIMDNVPGGFVRMRVDDDGTIKPVFLNKGFLKLVGMEYDEIMNIYANDALAGVHPDDVDIVKSAVTEMMQNGEARSSRYRLRHGNGDYIWLMIFGRITRSEDEKVFLNIYYSDATQLVIQEEQSKELLDNLPYGAGLYELNGKELTAVHLNKRYWELVGRQKIGYKGEDFLNAVHPEDIPAISRELNQALNERRDIVLDIRVLYGKDEYRPFHLVGRSLNKENNKFFIYAVYTPISLK